MRRSRGSTWLLVAICTLVFSSGCGRAVGPEAIPMRTISGRVLLDGRPVGGWLEIMPVEGTLGRLRSAALAADGSFTVTDIPMGRLAIRLAGPPIERTGDAKMDKFLFHARRMPMIRRSVGNDQNARLDIDLRAELAEFETYYPTFL